MKKHSVAMLILCASTLTVVSCKDDSKNEPKAETKTEQPAKTVVKAKPSSVSNTESPTNGVTVQYQSGDDLLSVTKYVVIEEGVEFDYADVAYNAKTTKMSKIMEEEDGSHVYSPIEESDVFLTIRKDGSVDLMTASEDSIVFQVAK